jgi:hypothetical protein
MVQLLMLPPAMGMRINNTAAAAEAVAAAAN